MCLQENEDRGKCHRKATQRSKNIYDRNLHKTAQPSYLKSNGCSNNERRTAFLLFTAVETINKFM